MIALTTDPSRRLIRVTMNGVLTVAEVEEFSRRKDAAVRAMGLISGQYLLLIQTFGNIVQAQDVMTALQTMILSSPLKAKRVATVRDGVLTRMQTRRLSKMRPDAEVFDTLAEAEAWLFADQPPAISPAAATPAKASPRSSAPRPAA